MVQKDFKAFIGQRGTSSRKVMEAYQGRRHGVFWERKKEKEEKNEM